MVKIINVDGVSVSRNGNIVLNNISFSVDKGEFIMVVGSNGSGKSTLLNVIAGVLDYYGYVIVNGYSVNKDNIKSIRRDVSIVINDMDNELVGETVLDELVFGLENLGYSRDYIKKRLDEVVNMFKIENILNKESVLLTNSEKELVYIANGLMNDPDILIIDEAIHQLSVSDKKLVFRILKKLKKEKKLTVIMSTNDTEDYFNFDRCIVMNHGKIEVIGSVVSVFKDKEMLNKLGIKCPFVIDFSLRLMDKGIIDHIYLDMRKLADKLWK